jgi:hypothetical protein
MSGYVLRSSLIHWVEARSRPRRGGRSLECALKVADKDEEKTKECQILSPFASSAQDTLG